MADSDSVFFILPPKEDEDEKDEKKDEKKKTLPAVYGVVCFQQVDSESVRAAATPEQSREITRNAVQKSVCLLLSQPLFETYLQRLRPVTQSFFAQRDFEPKVLVDFYDSLVAQQQQQQQQASPKTSPVPVRAADVAYANHARVVRDVPVREIVLRYGARRALQLLKLVLAEQSVIIAACKGHIHRACQLAMLAPAAIPLFFGVPPFFEMASEGEEKKEEGAEPSAAMRLWEEGLPLRVLDGDNTAFAPYLCLQQMAALSQKRFFVAGVSNPLFLRAAATKAAAVLEVERDSVRIAFGSAHAQAVAELTGADRRFADSLDSAVRSAAGASSGFVGSSEWLLAQFTRYIEGLLACYASRQLQALSSQEEKKEQQQEQEGQESQQQQEEERNDLGLYGGAFVAAWERTTSFAAWWAGQTRAGVAARVWPVTRAVHPGGESALQVLGRDLQRGFREDIQPLAARIGTTVSAAATTFGHAVRENALRAQAAIKESAERRRAEAEASKAVQKEEGAKKEEGQEQEKKEAPPPAQEPSVQQKVSGWWSAFSRNVADTVTRVGKSMDDGLNRIFEPTAPAAAATNPAANTAADESVFDSPPLPSDENDKTIPVSSAAATEPVPSTEKKQEEQKEQKEQQ